jgi:hypothetical protein
MTHESTIALQRPTPKIAGITFANSPVNLIVSESVMRLDEILRELDDDQNHFEGAISAGWSAALTCFRGAAHGGLSSSAPGQKRVLRSLTCSSTRNAVLVDYSEVPVHLIAPRDRHHPWRGHTHGPCSHGSLLVAAEFSKGVQLSRPSS